MLKSRGYPLTLEASLIKVIDPVKDQEQSEFSERIRLHRLGRKNLTIQTPFTRIN